MLIQDPPVEIADGVWMLGTRQYPAYFFKSEQTGTLIEGGISATGTLVPRQIESLGSPAEDVTQLIITHAHPDHVMAVPQIRRAFPAIAVLASPLAAQTLANEKAVSFFRQMDEALIDGLSKMGLIAADNEKITSGDLTITVDRTVDEGDTIRTDGISLTVLATPGHSDCSLSFHDPETGLLIISDATGYYMPQHDDWWPNYFGNYADYLSSMRRLAELGASVLGLSHNAVIQGADDVNSYFRRAIATTEQYHQRIVTETKAGKTVRELAGQLGTEIHRRTPVMPVAFFQKNCALLVKKSLEHEGLQASSS
jgi:glyoxylase-like metal-dependent hydrolase (beta-lactamase superfamily II)